MKKALCVLSGGLDSTVLLYHLIDKGYKVEAMSFNYGQRHKRELLYAKETCKELSIPHKIVDISNFRELLSNSCLTSNSNIPEGHYEAESMKQTVVSNRNCIMLSIAGGYAVDKKFDYLAIAVHAGDHHIYPDCRMEFIRSFEQTLQLGNYHQVVLYTPFLHITKGGVVKEGKRLGVDFSKTWSCYKGRVKPCGKCRSCNERNEALKLGGVV